MMRSTTVRAVPSSSMPCSATVSPMAATGWRSGGTAAVSSGTRGSRLGCTAMPVSRPVAGSTGPRVNTGKGVRAWRCAWINTTEAW